MSDNYLVYKDQLHPNVIEMLSEDIGDVDQLSTESKTVVGALNELIGKDIIAEKFGSPLSFTDSWSDMGNKIETVENKLRTNLIGKDVDVNGVEDINGLVDKVNEISTKPFPEDISIMPMVSYCEIEPSPVPFSGAVPFTIGNYVYYAGGRSNVDLKTMLRTNIITGKTEQLKDLTINLSTESPTQKSISGCTVIGANAYILDCSRILYKYDSVLDVWTQEYNTAIDVSYRDKTALVGNNNKIIIVGYGTYDLETKSLTAGMTTSSRLGFVVSEIYNGEFYTFGGYDSSWGTRPTIDKYDVNTLAKTELSSSCYNGFIGSSVRYENKLVLFFNQRVANPTTYYENVVQIFDLDNPNNNAVTVNIDLMRTTDKINSSYQEYVTMADFKKGRVLFKFGKTTSDKIINNQVVLKLF